MTTPTTMTIPRLAHNLLPDVMFIRPRWADDHRDFESLLPEMTPLCVYADEDGRDWIRWSMPKSAALDRGWGEMKCACCGETENAAHNKDSFVVDTARNEVEWFFPADTVIG